MLLCHKCPLHVPSACAVPSAVTSERQTVLMLLSPPHPVPTPPIHAEESMPPPPRFLQNIILPCFFTCTARATVCERPFMLHTAFQWPFATKEPPYCNSTKKKEVTVLSYQDGRIFTRHTSAPRLKRNTPMTNVHKQKRGSE